MDGNIKLVFLNCLLPKHTKTSFQMVKARSWSIFLILHPLCRRLKSHFFNDKNQWYSQLLVSQLLVSHLLVSQPPSFPVEKHPFFLGVISFFWGITDLIWFTFYILLSWWSTFFWVSYGFIWFHQFHPHPTGFLVGPFLAHHRGMAQPRSAVPLRSESQGLSQRRADPSADAAEEHRGTASGSWWRFFWGDCLMGKTKWGYVYIYIYRGC